MSAIINITSQFELTNKLFLGAGEEKAQSERFLNLYECAQLKGRRGDGESAQGKTIHCHLGALPRTGQESGPPLGRHGLDLMTGDKSPSLSLGFLLSEIMGVN